MCTWRIWGRNDHGSKAYFAGKAISVFLVLLLILNGFFFLYQQTGMTGDIRFYGDAYSRRIDELSGYTWEEVVEQCQADRDYATEQIFTDSSWSADPEKYAVPPPGPGSPGAVCVSDFL